MANSTYKTVKSYSTEKIEIVVMLLVLFVIASAFYPELRNLAYIALAGLLGYFLLQMLLQSGIILEIPEYKRCVVLRMGHYHRVAGPGWVFVVPILEKVQVVDLRVQTMDLQPQEVITTDQIRATIDAVVYYQVVNPKLAILKVKEFEKTITGYVFAAMRDIASNLTLNELYGELEKVNDIIKVKVEPMAEDWGITLRDVQIVNVTIPEHIQEAMHARRKAREEFAAAQFEARAQKTVIEALGDASKKLDDRALTYLYIREALPKIAEGKSTKVFFPVEFAKLAENLGSAGISHKEVSSAAAGLYPLALKKAKDMMDEESKKKESEEE